MLEQSLIFLRALLDQTAAIHLPLGNLVMIVFGGIMIYLAIANHCEPLLHIGIRFSRIVANAPGPPDVARRHAISALF